MPARSSERPDTSFPKALLAGLAGGLAGSAVKIVGEKLLPPRTKGQEPPPKLVVENLAEAAGVPLSSAVKKPLVEASHWVFGILAGGAYSVVAEYQPRATSWRGAVFGLTLNRLMHEGILPNTGVVEPVKDQPAQERISEWVTHVMYGVATEVVRGAVRRRL